MIKLIASDLDGTILKHGTNVVNPELIQVINQLGAHGIHFIAASGRPYCNLKQLFKEVTTPISFISENGAVYVFHDEIHVPSRHSADAVKQLVLATREDPDCDLFYSCEDMLYVEAEGDEVLKSIESREGYLLSRVDDLLAVGRIPVKLAIYNNKGLTVTAPKYQELFGESMKVITSGDLWLDFMPHGVNKGTALKHITDTMGIHPDECMAFGDQWNDVEMLSFVGTSFAMSNAAPGVADYATGTANSVLEELQKLLASLS